MHRETDPRFQDSLEDSSLAKDTGDNIIDSSCFFRYPIHIMYRIVRAEDTYHTPTTAYNISGSTIGVSKYS